jgi:PAS domain S-box-containing protein
MAEQLLSRMTTYGWLSLLAAMRLSELEQPGPQEITALCPLPAGVINLRAGRLEVMSPRLAKLLGAANADPHTVDLIELVRERRQARALFDLLATEVIDAYAARRILHPSHQSQVDVEVWVVACFPEDRRLALFIVAPMGEEAADYLPLPSAQAWPMEVDGLMVGTFDGSWRILRVSVDVERLFGFSVDEVVGGSMLDFIHEADVGDLFSAAARALVDRAAISAELRLRHKNGDVVPSRMLITPLGEEELHFGFAAASNYETPIGTTFRCVTLERHLWRIAREVEAAGISMGLDRIPDLTRIPGLNHLSPRQWEILHRQLRGERVPGIARDLHLSQSTVRNHLTQIFAKVGVHSQAELLELLRGAEPVSTREP